MSKRKSTKQALATSALSLILCISMLLGSTFAWFTDSVTSAGNIIKAGNLKIDMQWAEIYDGENTVWNDAEGANSKPVFDYDNWEPGYTLVRYIKVSNEGNLAFKYLMNIIPTGVVGKLAEVIDVQYDIVTNNDSFTAPTVDNKKGSLSTVGTLDQVLDNSKTVVSGVLLPEKEEKAGFYSGEIVACVSLHMQENAGNEYQEQSIGDSFKIQLLATQYTYESDSFGNLYDLLADYSIYVTQSKKLGPDADAVEFSIAHKDTIIATLNVPATAIADTSKPVTVTFDGIEPSETIVVGQNNKSFAYDIDVTNLKKNLSGDQLITVVLTAPNALPAVKTYHKGALIDNAVYDEVAGTITFKTDSFSPYAVSYKEYEVSTIDELRAHAEEDDANIKLMADLTINLDPNADENDCDAEHFSKLTGSYEYYNGVNINGKNVAIDLNGHNIVVSGDKDGDTVGAVFFIMPNSNLNITDSVGGGMIKAADPCYIVWAPYDAEYGLSYVDVYSGIFAAHSYAGDERTPGYFAMFYAGEGGLIDVYGGYYLYDNESYVDKNGVTHENVNNGAFNVMNSATTECITIHDGVMLINQHYRQDGYNSNNKNADHDSIFLAEHCALVEISKSVTIDGKTYDTWYQVQTTQPTKFETVFENTDKYIYRIGNQNTVALGSLFKTENAVATGAAIDVTITALENSNISGTYTEASDTTKWAEGTIEFTGTGLAKITINGYELTVEVVDAMNATTATSATKNNVVLLNDVGLHTIEVSNGYTLYGNGFKMEAKSDVMYDTMGVGFVTLKNGTLDNVQIICPNFSYSIVYNNQIINPENTAVPSDSSNDARGNVRSAVMVDGNSQIVNSYIHGGRAAIFLRSGNLVVDGSTISGGAAANIHTMSAQSLTLRNATLIQKPFKANVNDTSKTIMGFSGLFECGEDGNATPLILEGTLIQDTWINESYKQYAPSEASSIVTSALSKTDFIHDLDGDGKKESLNLGFTYIPQNTGGSTNANVTDNRTNKNNVPYAAVDVGNVLASAKVYSYKNTNGTSADFTTDGAFTPSAQGATKPSVSFTDTNADRVFETAFDTSDNRWESSLTVNLDNGDYTFNFAKLLVQKHGQNLTYTVKKADGTAVDTSKTIDLTASGVTEYVITVTDADGVTTHTVYFTLTATKTSIPEPELYEKNYADPLLVVKSKNSDWTVGIPALDGIKIKYYTSANNAVTLDLATLTPTSTGKQNGTNNFWEYSNGYKLKVTCGYIHEGKQVYGMPVVVDNNGTKQMYFTLSSTTGYVSTSTTARAVKLTYEFTDPNGKTLTFSNTWNVTYADYKDKAQYSYNDFVNGTMTNLLESSSGGSGCVTPDTLITLADGTQKRVDSLTGEEMLLVWNLETGKYDMAPIVFVDSEKETEYEIIHLYFSDGSDVKVISEHGFFDLDLGKYVYIDASNYADYVGHRFVTQGDIEAGNWNEVTLDKVVIETEVTTAWSPVTFEHLCYYTNGVLSMPGGIEGLFNIFEVDTDTMSYDVEKMQQDIETYGLFTLEDFGGLIPEIAFEAFNGDYLKVAIGKGLLTWEDIAYLAERYMPLI